MIVHVKPSLVLGLLRPLGVGRRHLNLKISAAAGSLTVSVLGYEATLPARVDRPGSFQIPHQTFAALLRTCEERDAEVLEADPAWLRLGRQSARLHEFTGKAA